MRFAKRGGDATSGTATIDIAHATPADVPALSGALARAFHDDPVFEWIIPDANHRRTRLPSVFAAFAKVYLTHDETYVAGNGAGAALWVPAGSEPFSEEQNETFGERMAAILGDDAGRAFELNELLQQHHPERPSFYLQFLGVVPEHRGRSLGSRMLTTVLERCDATGTPAYLEATSVNNRRLYQRHGFNTGGEITLTQGPSLWPMWREPVTAASASPARSAR